MPGGLRRLRDPEFYRRRRNCARPCNSKRAGPGTSRFSDRARQLFPDSLLIRPTCPDVAEWRLWPGTLGLRSADHASRSQLAEGALVITVPIVIAKTEREMAFREIWLQAQRLIGVATRLFPTTRCRIGIVI